MDLRKYDLYILDYDGTLIDSMPMWRSIASKYIKHLGYIPKEDLDDRIPIFTNKSCAETLKIEYDIPMSVQEIMEDISEYVDRVYPDVKLKAGAFELLNALRNLNKKIVVISASSYHIVDLSMKKLEIRDYFSEVISVDDNALLSKSNGSAMEFVRNKYNIKKDKILMMDDALASVIGAKSVGIDIIAIHDDFTSSGHKDELIKNSIAYMSMKELSDRF